MNKKMIIAWVAVFVAWMAGSFVVHGVLLHDDYRQLAGLFRTEADQQQFFPIMLFAHVLMAGSFVWMYGRGVEAKPWLAQGVRFGIAVALLAVAPTDLIYFAVQPMPASLVIKQIAGDGLLVVLLGILAAYIYKGGDARS